MTHASAPIRIARSAATHRGRNGAKRFSALLSHLRGVLRNWRYLLSDFSLASRCLWRWAARAIPSSRSGDIGGHTAHGAKFRMRLARHRARKQPRRTPLRGSRSHTESHPNVTQDEREVMPNPACMSYHPYSAACA